MKKPKLFLVLIALVFYSAAVSAAMASSISQYGITWTFDQEYETGQFVNGDYWVLGPVTVTSVTPVWDGNKNGSMLDPVPGADQSYDTRINDWYRYNDSTRVRFPTTINGIKSLISVRGVDNYNYSSSQKSAVHSAAVLTIVNEAVPAGTFRPAFVAGSKTFYGTSQVNYGLLPNLPAPPNVPDLSGVMKMPWLYHGPKTFGEELIFPFSDTGSPYPLTQTKLVSRMSLVILLDVPNKRELTDRLIQLGIDNYPMALQNKNAWVADGGYGGGHKWPILFAGIMLDDSAMKSPPQFYAAPYVPIYKFAEDGYPFYNQQNRVMFGTNQCWAFYGYQAPDPRCSSNCMCRDGAGQQYPEDLPGGGHYRFITSLAWVGEVLASRILNQTTGAMTLWNQPAFYDYTDEWTTRPDWWVNNSTAYYSDIYGYGGDGDGFMTYMWNLYRGPTCYDQIQNGDETGVDCGGSCPVCVVDSCLNGIQDGDETGVDCGGSCSYDCAGQGLDQNFLLQITALNGSVSRSPDKLVYSSGELVSLTAVPNSNYGFVSWGGDVNSIQNPVAITTDSNKTINAFFSLVCFDRTNDSEVNIFDLVFVAIQMFSQNPDLGADLDADLSVTISDLVLMGIEFGSKC